MTADATEPTQASPDAGRVAEVWDRTVTVVSTPDDGSCGIGAYAGHLLEAMRGVGTEICHVDQEERSTRHFVSLARRAAASDGEVVHVQHEYGLFRRRDSPYPGVMGVVFFPLLFLLTAIRGKSVVVTLHSVLKPTPEEAPFKVRCYLLLMHKLVATVADHLVFLSAECESRFREDIALDADEYSVLPHGVNATRSADVAHAEAKRRLGYDPDDTVVMIPGFVRPPKGHDVFVEIARELPEYEFLVAGGARPKGDDFDFAAEVAADAPENVTITGVLDEETFPVALSAADVALLPYRVVTQSGTFNWCAAQELPVLASDEPYFARMRREWDNLETVDIEDRDEIVARLRDLLGSEARRRELRENMRRFKRANSFQRVAEEHYRIYERVRADREAAGAASRADESGDAPGAMRPACSAQRGAPPQWE